MKFGLSLFVPHPKDVPSPENFRHVLALAKAAGEAGFDLLHSGHHYMVRDFQKFQVVPMLSRVAADSGDMLLSVVDLLTLNHPVRMAEQIATMDAITEGRTILTPALGYVDHDFETFNVARKYRRPILLESIDIIKLLWTQDDVTYHGKHFKIDGATINPKPVQKPRPPIWQPADATAGIIRAAEYGDTWLISSHHNIATVKEQLETYREHRVERNDYESHGITLPMMRVAYVAEDEKEALRAGEAYVRSIWDVYYKQFGQAAEMDDPEDFSQAFHDLKEDRFIFATPDKAISEIERYERELGVDLLLLNLPGTPEEQLRSIRLIGETVIPHFRARR